MALRPWYEDTPWLLAVLDLPPGAETDETQRLEINNALRTNMRQNKFTILRGWEPPERVSFEWGSIQKWVGSASQKVEWQGESLQATRHHN
jgi:hypothetical protein